MRGLLKNISDTPEYLSLLKAFEAGRCPQQVFGLTGAQRNLLVAALADRAFPVLLVVTAGEAEAGQVYDDLASLLPGVQIEQFPVYELLPYYVLAHGKEVLSGRLRVLESLCAPADPPQPMIVVAPVEALLRRLSPPEVFSSMRLELSLGDRLAPGELAARLVAMGFERTELVESPGHFSTRGGIVDLYPLTGQLPVRLEFFDDEVDSIRYFEVGSQRSGEKLNRLVVFPAREFVPAGETWPLGQGAVRAEYRMQQRKLTRAGDPAALNFFEEHFGRLTEMLNDGVYFPGLELFLPYFYPRPVSLLDYLPATAPVFLYEPGKVRETVQAIQRERTEAYADLLTGGKVLPGQSKGYLDWEDLLGGLAPKPA
ncbi:MAG: transcription-repair coupling factor, partial [Firmicutes bacterium]|nr:transcription-repair coupling factor [Bacillota bacterium]